MSSHANTIYRGMFFVAVGLVSSASYLATMSMSIEWLGLSVLTSAFFAFCVGTTISYLGNTLFTFRAPMSRGNFAKFLLVVLVGLGVNQTIAYGLNHIGAHYLVIAATVFIVVPIINFIGHSLFTYREVGV
ncbi:GtrA family protein [Microvirga sp. BT688]|uniref:GtrA family protein n=1 Tax=Microvirga sp. TaxID=1873136 RepID=UPI001689CB37|nr:GtrA family protein [Microvirga sp.]MBD2750020.1 GtrA family protein [Microvirga sp.]